MILDLLLVGRTDDDAPVRIAHFPEDGGETEAEDDGDEDRPEGVGHYFLEHLELRSTCSPFFFEGR